MTEEVTIKLNGHLATYRLADLERTIRVDCLNDLAVHLWRNTDLPRDTRLHFFRDGRPLWPNSPMALSDAASWDF